MNLQEFKSNLSHSEQYLFKTQAEKTLAYDENLYLQTILKELKSNNLPVTIDPIIYLLWKIDELNESPIRLTTIRKAIK